MRTGGGRPRPRHYHRAAGIQDATAYRVDVAVLGILDHRFAGETVGGYTYRIHAEQRPDQIADVAPRISKLRSGRRGTGRRKRIIAPSRPDIAHRGPD